MGATPYPRVTMQINYGTVGISESHYYSQIVPVTNAAFYAACVSLIQARCFALDGKNAVVVGVKMSQDNINRDVNYLKIGDIPVAVNGQFSGGPNVGGSGWTWQSPHLSWPMKLIDANQNSIAITYIAGMPASVFQTGNLPTQASQGTLPSNFLGAYASTLVGSVWGAVTRDWPAGTFNLASSTPCTAPVTYTAASAFTPPYMSFTVAAAGNTASLAAGSILRIGGLKYTSPQSRLRLNGTYTVASYVGGVAVCYCPRVKIAPAFTSIPYVQCSTPTFSLYQSNTLDAITHRKRGRPIGAPRGRAPAR